MGGIVARFVYPGLHLDLFYPPQISHTQQSARFYSQPDHRVDCQVLPFPILGTVRQLLRLLHLPQSISTTSFSTPAHVLLLQCTNTGVIGPNHAQILQLDVLF